MICSCAFSANKCPGAGGATAIIQSSVEEDNTHYDSNWAGEEGGASFFMGPGSLTTSSNVYQGNTASGSNNGGAIYTLDSHANITTCSFTNNAAKKLGGALYVENSEATQISNSNFEKNGAQESAGGIMWTGSSGSVISRNTATQGGGIAVEDAQGSILQSTLSENSAVQGGGIYVNSTFNISDSTILSNTASGGIGDGIFIASKLAESGLIVTSTRLSNVSPFKFCCGTLNYETIGSVNDEICRLEGESCEISNGYCDYHTTCTEMNGGVECSACPEGFSGTPSSGCIDQCGDGFCDPTESCSTCSEDGGLCSETACPGKPACSNKGQCVSGTCVCSGGWEGPTCEQSNSPISLNFQKSAPGVTISPSNSNVPFSLTINAIQEIDQNGMVVASADLESQNYTSLLSNDQSTNEIPK
ncbi:unnamed protein product, partial [Rotaria magnacalcarata]